MSDSVKLRFERAILCLVLSYLALIGIVVSIALSITVAEDIAILLIIFIPAFIISVAGTISNFENAITISKKEEKNKYTKRAMNKTLD